MHPALGNAILSVKALAIANSQGLDIVTDSMHVHEIVAAQSESEVFDALLSGKTTRRAPTADAAVDDLAEVVMTAAFDVRGLKAQQIADLLNNGHDLRQFKNALVPLAATLPAITDSKERQRRLDSLAHDVLKKWDKYRKSLPKFALDALIGATDLTWPGLASSSFFMQPHTWPIGAALGVGILTYKGTKIISDYREHSSGPYRYLSNIANVAKRRQLTLSIAPPR